MCADPSQFHFHSLAAPDAAVGNLDAGVLGHAAQCEDERALNARTPGRGLGLDVSIEPQREPDTDTSTSHPVAGLCQD